MSVLIYNGIVISHVKTDSFTRTPIFSPDSADYLYTHVQLEISGIINPKATAYALDEDGKLVPTPGVSAPDTDIAIRHRLMQPRRQLIYMVGFTPLLISPAKKPGNNTGYYKVDCNVGPTPRGFHIRQLGGEKTFVCSFSIETHILECEASANSSLRSLISNRYHQQHDIEGEHYLTRITTVGQAFFRSDLLTDQNAVVDQFRRNVIPPVPLGFKRVGFQVAVTSSRNAMTYSTVDQETMFDLGNTSPALGGSGVLHVESEFSTSTVHTPVGVATGTTLAQMGVRVKGARESNNWKLVEVALTVARAKLPLDKPPANGFINQISVTQNLTSREVSLVISMQLPPSQVGKVAILNTDILAKVDLFPDRNGQNPGLWGDGGVRNLSYQKQILTSLLHDACTSVGKPTEGALASNLVGDNFSTDQPLRPVISFTDDLPSIEPQFSYGQIKSPHTDYRISARYSRKVHAKQIPVAKGPKTSSNQSTDQSPKNNPLLVGQNPSTDPANQPTLVPDCEIVYLAAPTTQVAVEWTAERVGEMPVYPHPFMGMEDNFVLLGDDVQPCAPELMPDGTSYVYRVSGKYTYALLSSRGAGDFLPTFALPMFAKQYEDNYMTPANSRLGILGPTPGNA